jgi:hypothetical protein
VTPLLAICEGASGSSRIFGIVVPPLIVGVWALFLGACVFFESEPEERPGLVGVFIAAAIAGGAIFLLPEGVSGNGDYLGRFAISVLAALVIGVLYAWKTERPVVWRSLGVALAGDVLVPGGLILMLFWGLSLGGGCLD